MLEKLPRILNMYIKDDVIIMKVEGFADEIHLTNNATNRALMKKVTNCYPF